MPVMLTAGSRVHVIVMDYAGHARGGMPVMLAGHASHARGGMPVTDYAGHARLHASNYWACQHGTTLTFRGEIAWLPIRFRLRA